MLIVFTALHEMQTRSSDQTRGLWQNGIDLSRFLYHTKDH